MPARPRAHLRDDARALARVEVAAAQLDGARQLALIPRAETQLLLVERVLACGYEDTARDFEVLAQSLFGRERAQPQLVAAARFDLQRAQRQHLRLQRAVVEVLDAVRVEPGIDALHEPAAQP